MNGYSETLPSIKALRFSRHTIELVLADGRIISSPLSKFPSIKKLSPAQREKYHIMAGLGFDFDDSDEVYHISDFLGTDNSISTLEKKIKPYSSAHSLSYVAEQGKKYKIKKRGK